MDGKIHGKQIKDTSVDLLKIDLSAGQGSFILGTGSYLGSYDTPNTPQAYVTKQYADSLSAGLDPKKSVYLVATTNITRSGAVSIDGLTASVGSRVLLTGQANTIQNGIYDVAAGAWTRATDSNNTGEVSLGNYTFVEKGTTYASTGWVLFNTDSTTSDVTVDTNTQLWTQFNGAGSFIWGDGITNSGNTINLDLDTNSGLTFSSGKVRVDNAIAGDGLVMTTGVLNIGAGDGISVDTTNVAINYTEAAIGLEGAGLSASAGKLNIIGLTAIGVTNDGLYVKYDTATIGLDVNGALTVISAGDAILDIVAGRGLTGSSLSGPTASLDLDITTGGGLTYSANNANGTLQVDYTTVAIGLEGKGLTASAGKINVNVSNGLIISSDSVQIDPNISGAGLTYSAGVININVAKGVTFSGDALFSDASTILTTANLPTLSIGTNSTIQSALTAIDNKLINVGTQTHLSFTNNVSGTFLKSINAPQNILNGFTFSSASDGTPSVYINGIYVKVSSATVSTAVYFSTNGGTTGTSTIEVGSVLYSNPNVLGFNLDANDVYDVNYLTRLT